MSIIRNTQAPPTEMAPGVSSQPIVTRDTGAANLTVNEITLAPGGRIPLHTHPTHEEGIFVLEGEVEAAVGDQTQVVSPGYTVLAPLGVHHQMTNRSDRPVRILAIFPTLDVQRQFIES